FGLRVAIDRAEVRRRRRRVDVRVALLHRLAVVAFVRREAEEPLFQDQIALVPERDREAESLSFVRDPEEPVLDPAIGSPPRVIVREVVPAGAGRRIVLTDRTPRSLGEIRPPATPRHLSARGFGEASFFFVHRARTRGGVTRRSRTCPCRPCPCTRPSCTP